MEAKDKSQELVDKFLDRNIFEENQTDAIDIAQSHALICVDEQIDYIRNFTPLSWQVREAMTNELEEVKQGIEKL